MTRRILVGTSAVAAMLFLSLPAIAQGIADNPVGGAVQNFFTLTPAGNSTPPPSAFGGGRCEEIVPKVGAQKVWWGRFSGGRVRAGGGRHDRMYNFTADGCFPSRGACEGWMYVLKSKFSDNPRFNDCRAGYAPGAPVRWVFGPNSSAN